MGELVVRPALPADAEAVAGLADELNAGQGEDTGRFTPELIRREAFGAAPEFRILLAEEDGMAVGYALFHPTFASELGERGFFLYDLLVTERARGRGVGRALMAALARLAADEGRSFLWWTTKAGNKAAQAFYRRLGAIDEDMKAHALFGDAFTRLLAEAPPRRSP